MDEPQTNKPPEPDNASDLTPCDQPPPKSSWVKTALTAGLVGGAAFGVGAIALRPLFQRNSGAMAGPHVVIQQAASQPVALPGEPVASQITIEQPATQPAPAEITSRPFATAGIPAPMQLMIEKVPSNGEEK
jgi:hypothetical protein